MSDYLFEDANMKRLLNRIVSYDIVSKMSELD